MNEENQIQIIELMDDGATLESSPELKALVEASAEATEFYESLLISESMLKGFFGGDKFKKLSNKIDLFIDEHFEKPSYKTSSLNFKPIFGFALAASFAFLAINFIDSPEERVELLVMTLLFLVSIPATAEEVKTTLLEESKAKYFVETAVPAARPVI